jgi:serine/threonine protein kinase
VLLHAPDADVRLGESGRAGVYGLDGHPPNGLPGIVAELLAAPPRDERNIVDATRSKALGKLIKQAGIRLSVRHRTVGTSIVDEQLLAEGPGWQDYRARHTQLDGVVRRVRFYLVARAASREQRATIERAARREFALLNGVTHPGIAPAVDFVDHERGPAVVFELDPSEKRLDHFLAEHRDSLSMDAKLDLVRALANTVRYAHGRRLVHRRLSPHSITVRNAADGQHGVRVRDWQTAGRLLHSATQGTYVSGTRHLDVLTDPGAAGYLAPEGYRDPDADPMLLDVFGLGAVAYHVLTGDPPADGADDLLARISADDGLDLAAVLDGVPDGLRSLVYEATYGDPDLRTDSAAGFLRGLDAALDELTRPERAEQIDPLDAQPEDLLGPEEQPARFRVLQRLGRGSTAQALLVQETSEANGQQVVLKIALDEGKAQRLYDEAEVLAAVRDHRVAGRLGPPLTIGGRTALVLEDAGRESVAALLREQGRLSLDLLERWGRDLLQIVQALDLAGVSHRDIKPDNLSFRELGSRRQRHLTLFDFSLSRAPLEETNAGTVPYLDPFFGAGRPHWDAAAERYAAAVTLFEMATGTLPVYGDAHAHPAVVDDDVSLSPDMFDPAVPDGLLRFFATALARDPRDRQDTVDDMLAGWNGVFAAVPEPAAGEESEPVPGDERDEQAARAERETPLEGSGLTPRAQSALTRLGIATVGELIDRPQWQLAKLGGNSEATRREVRRRAKKWRQWLTAETPEKSAPPTEEKLLAQPDDRPESRSIDAVLNTLLPKSTARNETEVRTVHVLLGLADPQGGKTLTWPTQREVAEQIGVTAARVNQIATDARAGWRRSTGLTAVIGQVVDLLDDAGGVLSAEEIAGALLTARGSVSEDADRLARGLGLLRAAVEVELDRGGDARMELRRVHDTMLVGREPDDPQAPRATALLDYAVALSGVADKLATEEPSPSPGRAADRLRAVPTPDGVVPPSDGRLLRLAAASSAGAAVTARGEIYPVGMPAERALRSLASGLSALRFGFSERQLAERLRARYPQAADLPHGSELDQALRAAGVRVEFRDGRYEQLRSASTGLASADTRTRVDSSVPAATVKRETADLDQRLRDSLTAKGFLTLSCRGGRLDDAAETLTKRFPITAYDVTAELLAAKHRVAEENNADWTVVLRADRPDAPARDAAHLRLLLDRAFPPIEGRIAEASEPLLLVNAEPLARYDRLGWLEQLADPANERPAARWLLVPASGDARMPMLDSAPAPTVGGWAHLPSRWLDRAEAVANA